MSYLIGFVFALTFYMKFRFVNLIKQMMKSIQIIFIVVTISLCSCMTDLRTDYNAKEGYKESLQKKGRYAKSN